MSSPHGGIYVSAGAASQALSTTPAKMTGFVTALPGTANKGDTSVSSTVASDQIELKANGTYLLLLDMTGSSDTADINIIFKLYAGAAAITGATCRLLGEAAAVSTNTSMSFLYKPTANVSLSVYAESASGTPAFTPQDGQLIAVRLR